MGVNADMSALFKQVFGDGVVKAVPDFAKIQKDVPFSAKERTGNYFEIPVVLELEQGFTYQAYGTLSPTLNNASGGFVGQAQVNGAIIILRSQMSYDQLYRASQAGPQAFKDALGALYDNMIASMTRRLEISLILGGSSIGLGQVSTISSHVITFTNATWSPGVWAGMIGASLDSYTTGLSAHDSGITITGISMSNKTITVSGDSSTVANDILFFHGAQGTECTGIQAILANTGNLFNISASSHPLWQGNSYNVGGPISMAGILNGVSMAVNLGLMEEAKVYIAPKRWNVLNSDQAALRRYDKEENSFANGADEIVYYSANGKITLVPHPIVPEGYAYLLPNPSKRLMRVGSTEITFRRPGREDEDLFLEVPNTAAVELRLFCDQQIFIPIPAQCTLYTGITD